MNYDNWKLSNPIDDGGCSMVSSCCGSEYEEIYSEMFDEDKLLCSECNEYCEIIEDYEYKAIQRENYLEDMRNE
ncbi:MAG: hypothetical protein GOVbin1629_9 [Prokaryotic dsDNA virus sp.]|nr:MAG: hypothetical protein GOVbin1629_9 [Prokaryotic dsDNA virus sp.]|tara:strand:- start:19302 stop:19523 length:222 start_codon:yes stop_codon:yes gene_type:complete